MGVVTGGGGPINAVTLRLTDTQILALGTTPQVVAAGVPGSIILPVTAVLVINGGAYTGGSIQFFLGATSAGAAWRSSVFTNNPLSFTDSAITADVLGAWANDPELITALEGQPMCINSTLAVSNLGSPGSVVLTVSYLLNPVT